MAGAGRGVGGVLVFGRIASLKLSGQVWFQFGFL